MTTTDDQPTSASTSMTSTEEAIAAIWRDLLEIDEIETDDDFFDIGATSSPPARSFWPGAFVLVDDHFGKGALSPEQLYEDSRLSILAKAIDDNVGAD